jgi:regulator of cell morphogenesis and NO signaling
MTISRSTLIADIAATGPSSVRVVQRHGVDFCCGGKQPLAVACEDLGLSFDDLAREIDDSATVTLDNHDWTMAPLHELTDHIVSTYHDALRVELPRLSAMAARVAAVHGARAPQTLPRIDAVARELKADLLDHMRKEEVVLFPAIGRLEAGGAAGLALAAPIHVMQLEHDRAGDLLAELRLLTEGFVEPEWACATTRALYQGLAQLEQDMHLHVHLENNVLFPRALALASQPR